ncbi:MULTISPECIES: sigma-70 family RNA polymerase sigma factor [unclassified Pseudomonas]|uniref:sigma-70 family RNA polymerase sigma factor n=1 Tax=unclassified Pseudomonas TaxID=196821 RepID=UPI00244D5952|nr:MULTISPECIES: sigma-70 family RNA polymerase sigma factor [unclassified Pseudomonas]MDG9926962.1 sigma-70 family RNA polymerase sigma factor [Pseudomonas sp. GD04042]MDH0484605.1 sigma-70 family RNA polymerase sigma factor [Pseudomonas sp. GD04015]MDH0602377.1 sigma-70 family RNA polymerase sigma factor [Pseudomonas sp. GD03869]
MSTLDKSYRQQVELYYAEHHGWVRAWLNRKLGNSSDAADLAHDVFLRLLSKPRRFDSDNHARAYLSAMSRHVCVDFWRRRQVEQAWLEVLASRPEDCAPSEEHRALILEALQQVHGMLASLPEKVAEAFLLAQLQGLNYRCIGQRLGVSERTVTKYMAQAMYQCLLLEAELDTVLDR